MSVESSPDIIHTHQLNYKPIQEANCKYRFIRIPLNNVTSSSVTVGASSSQLLEWKLPNAVYNLAQSYITYNETMANSTPLLNGYLEDTVGLASNIYFGNASGADLCNLNYGNKYIKIARKLSTPLNEYLTNDYDTSLLYPCNTAAASNLFTSTATTNTTTAGTTAFIEPKYIAINPNTGAYERDRQFQLGSIPDTIFSVDKDIYIPTDMFIRITAGPANSYTYTVTAASVADPSHNSQATAVDVTLTNVYLYLAVETNQLIIDSVISKVRSSGLTMNIPYTTGFRNSSTGIVGNINVPLSSQYGKKMKQILTTVWNGTETGFTCGDSSNASGRKIASYNTFLNNRQLQDTSIDCTIANVHDWRENARHVLGSVIQNRTMYGLNWFHLDKFYEDNKGSIVPEENRQDGYDMNQGPVLYQLQATTANGTWIYYQFCSFSRDVVLNNQGFMYV